MGQELKPALGQGCWREQVGGRESTAEGGEPKGPGTALLPSSQVLGAARAAPARLLGRGCSTAGLPGEAPGLPRLAAVLMFLPEPGLAASPGCDSVSPLA